MTLGDAPGAGTGDTASRANGEVSVVEDTPGGEVPLSGHSRFVQRLRRRYAAELPLLEAGTPGPDTIAAAYEALRSRGHDVACALRIVRQLVLERLVTLDCDQQAPLETILSLIHI